ncbi:MAG TPA: hypothetical protein VHX62_15730 [Solirubrobacteraceae bacterium]|jgi:hypothetical protein|nr:hypothetical protein [Solirubrobacteraceae bacterium]
MSSVYLLELRRRLTALGITGSLRGRIVDEIADHLECDPDADLGDPAALARQFADELGSVRARTAALAGFAGLVVAGVVFSAAFLVAPNGMLRGMQSAGPHVRSIRPPGWAIVPAALEVLFTQLALAAGCLAALRWFWRRGSGILPAAEAGVLVRRAVVGVGAGAVCMVCLALVAVAGRSEFGSGWTGVTIAAAGLGLVALLATLPSLWAAARVRPVAGGRAGDVIDDLGPLAPAGLRGRPWRFALLVAAAIAVLLTVVSLPAGDLYDGAARGIFDGLACLIGFGLLGPYLGLWSPRRLDGGDEAPGRPIAS